MKRTILLIGILAAMVGCQDNFLDEIPQDFIGPDQFFRNGKDAVTAVNAVYKGLTREVQRYYFLTDYPGEAVTARNQTATAPSGIAAYDNNLITETSYNLITMWQKYYQIISNANFVLAKVGEMDESKIDASLKNRVLGEAYFLRGLSYFTLVRFFGGIPLQVKAVESITDAEPMARNTDAEIYNQIIADLEQAIDFLPKNSTYLGNDIGRASEGSAKALLAKVYLQRGSLSANNGITGDRQIAQTDDFQKSAALCQEVISGGEYQLVPYKDLWGFDAVDQNNEVIFAVQHSISTNPQYSMYMYIALYNSDLPGPKYTHFQSNIEFYKSFSSNDIRKSVIFYTQYVLNGDTITYNMDDPANDGYFTDTPTFTKYLTGKTFPSGADEIVLRYADVLLIKAEALNEVNRSPNAEAYESINQVRNRVGLDNLPAGLSYTQFKDSVYIERQKEFVLEGQAWFDGQRYFSFYKKILEEWSGYDNNGPHFGPFFKIILEDKDRLFPINIVILDANPLLEQNPGWEGFVPNL